MTGIFTAPTLEEAKRKAADAFGAPETEIQFTVLDEPKRSLLSGLFGKKEKEEFRVQADFTPVMPAAEEAEAAPAETPAPAEEAPAPIEEAAEEEGTAEPEETGRRETSADVSEDVKLEKMAIGAAYLEKILAELAPGVTVTGRLENGISYTLDGDTSGALIGRRGETLDALQYLTSMVANRGDKDYVRMTIDTCNYRDKRKKALTELATRISKNVLRTGRSIALEPMNPYERRIIHSTVTAIEGVSSHSAGEEPNRKVIITCDNAPAGKRDERPASYRDRGRRNDRRDGRNDRDRRDRRPRRAPGEGPRKLDLSTSFEKDYKRPKPEDALNTGVYGKIDI